MRRNTIKDLKTIVSSIITDKIDMGESVSHDWAVTGVLNEFPDVQGADVDFYLTTARSFILKIVKESIKKYEPTGESAKQMVLDGFEHLQKAYPVERGGQRLIVPVNVLSNDELEARALDLELMAESCVAHAKEIRLYIVQRKIAM